MIRLAMASILATWLLAGCQQGKEGEIPAARIVDTAAGRTIADSTGTRTGDSLETYPIEGSVPSHSLPKKSDEQRERGKDANTSGAGSVDSTRRGGAAPTR